jgi:hypothetical protein
MAITAVKSVPVFLRLELERDGPSQLILGIKKVCLRYAITLEPDIQEIERVQRLGGRVNANQPDIDYYTVLR